MGMMRHALLCGLFAVSLAWPGRAAEIPERPAASHAVNLALPLLQKCMAEYPTHTTCFSCHHEGAPLFALSLVRKRGFVIDAKAMADAVKYTTADLKADLGKYQSGVGQPGGVTRAGYAMLALQSGGAAPGEITSAVTGFLLQKDRDHGGWRSGSNRPPSEASGFTNTFLAVRALNAYGDRSRSEDIRARIAQARIWLETTPTKETEDRVFQLWGMREAGSEQGVLKAAAVALLKEQNEDGGWAQVPHGASDAYATATALTALHEAGGLPETMPYFRRGAEYLLKTQQPDGSWHVTTRSKPVQPYFESGFPYGKDQFISMTATAWATAALALASPLSPMK